MGQPGSDQSVIVGFDSSEFGTRLHVVANDGEVVIASGSQGLEEMDRPLVEQKSIKPVPRHHNRHHHRDGLVRPAAFLFGDVGREENGSIRELNGLFRQASRRSADASSAIRRAHC